MEATEIVEVDDDIIEFESTDEDVTDMANVSNVSNVSNVAHV